MLEFLSQPSQMMFWSKPENLINFIRIQAQFHHAGAGPQVSESGYALEECAAKLTKIYKLEDKECMDSI